MFENERGRNQTALCEDPLTRKGVDFWLERVLGFYGEDGGVDVEVIEDMLLLNGKTEAYIYSDFTPLELKYVSGTRPMLEQIIEKHVRAGMSEREKARSLMLRVRDNQDHGLARADLFYGGDEEDLMKRGAIMCNEVSRLYACLCQIAGLPARLYCAHISGHMMNEIFIDGRWAWVDSMCGLMPVRDDGELASGWELHLEPKLWERQPKSVWDDCRPPHCHFGTNQRDPRNLARTMANNRDNYCHPREALAIGNYFVWDHGRYTYPWIIEPADPDRLGEAKVNETHNRKAAGWPDHYFNPLLVTEELKMR